MIRRVTPKTRIGDRQARRHSLERNVWATMPKRTIFIVFLTLFGSSLALASTRVGNTKPMVLQSNDTRENQLIPVAADTTAPRRAEFLSKKPSPIIDQSNQVSMGEAILNQIPSVTEETILPQRAEFLSQLPTQVIRQGTKVSLNGRIVPVAWRQWQLGASVRTAVSDAGLKQTLGMELLSTKDLVRQPVQWFSDPPSTPLVLASQLGGSYRYLDVTDFARIAGWRLQVAGDTLQLSFVPARVENISVGTESWGDRIVIDLDRPTPWQMSDRRTEGVITLEGSADSSLIQRFNAPPPTPQIQDAEDAAPVSVEAKSDRPVIRIENAQNQTTLRVSIPDGKRLQVYSLPNPYRLVIELRPDALVEKEILWAPGIRWHQQYVNLENSRFPVVWLEVNPRSPGISLRPIWSNPATQVGTAPLIQTAQLWQAAAAINAGFFNRNNQLPLGAIRRDGRWFSGPILNRGAIAWNDAGQFKLGRFTLQETLLTSTGERLPILFLNSGYVQPGIARYTPEWGTTYTPLTDNEILVVVQNNQVTSQLPGGTAGQAAFPIPTDGYLLTLRPDSATVPASLGVGTQVSIETGTTPTDFGAYPHILGAGPLLVQNRQIVLDAKAEQFKDAFIQQSAVRSCIGTTAAGTLMLVAVHNRIGGLGPNLTETAQLMQLIGAVDAINFDGGSSTGLYLGGQLLDRSPYTAARVHNGLGIFVQPLP